MNKQQFISKWADKEEAEEMKIDLELYAKEVIGNHESFMFREEQ